MKNTEENGDPNQGSSDPSQEPQDKPLLTTVEGKVNVELFFQMKLDAEGIVQFVNDMEGWLNDVILDYISDATSEDWEDRTGLVFNKTELQRIQLSKPFNALIKE